MTRHAVSVLIVDDQAPFRSAARAVVAMSPGFQPVAEVESGEAAVAAATEFAPELVLMDIHLPGINGIEATRRILRAHPATVVILLSTYRAADLPPEARQCGAASYVHKEDFDPGVLRAIWDKHASDGSASRQ
jgi:two-component system, NarL family, invasion response regulator UvrY